MTQILEIKNLKTYFSSDDGVMPSVDGVDLSLNEGEVVGLAGESGCGKTVLSLSIVRLVPHPGEIISGEIYFKDCNLLELKEKEMQKIRGNDIAMIFQDPLTSLNPVFTIEEQMTRPLIVHKKISRNSASEIAVDMLKKVGVTGAEKRIHEYPHQFSGGQRQRIMIATALSLNPGILIADEPTTALDVSIQAQILKLLSDLQHEYNTSTIFISHDLGVIANIAHKVVIMYSGWIVEEADTGELFGNPCHPYTKALLDAVPTIYGENKKLRNLPGNPPSVGEKITGCKLHPRCPQKVKGLCDKSIPEYYKVGSRHRVRCFLFQDK
ncbi:MAG: ABC transporter ATP-binding protein [Candidatus Eremiobacteraeota bacterium]|nr:ABC transporter ATP-binding protein [Candidatus Eremiobacteraeota bacterium]